MAVRGDELDPLLGKRVCVHLREGADVTGVLRVNLRKEQRFLLRERGGIDQVIYYDKAVGVEDLERPRSWWRRVLRR